VLIQHSSFLGTSVPQLTSRKLVHPRRPSFSGWGKPNGCLSAVYIHPLHARSRTTQLGSLALLQPRYTASQWVSQLIESPTGSRPGGW
jgi:hypothetical protein